MISNAQTIDRRMLTRKCVSCGFDGVAINRQIAQPFEMGGRHGGVAVRSSTVSTTTLRRCPRCSCDFLQRPPRSYAEMEGLLGTPAISQPRAERIAEIERQEQGQRLVHRWLAFLFVALVGILAIAYLAAAVLTI